ncbi:MAG: PAS domain S-box protein [Elusimicrobia bacterium]|nr:PAS domain S-box protein [Elusimicrobiota bacterium]
MKNRAPAGEKTQAVQLFARLLDFTQDGVYRYTFAEGKILFANSGFIRILDLDFAPGEVAGKLLRDLMTYTEEPGTIRKHADLKGKIHNFEYHFKTLKGADRWVLHDSFVTADPKTGEKVVEAFVRDITERKRSEAALRDSEERLRFAREISGIGAWDLDLVDHTAFRSVEHDRIFGYAELLPKWTYEMFLEHVLPEDRALVDEKFRRATATESNWNFECRIRRTDGQVRWIWAAGRHQRNAAGAARRMAGIVQDITERKQAETALQASEKKFRAMAETSPLAIYLSTGIEQKASYINPRFIQVFGYTLEDVPTVGDWWPRAYPDEKYRQGIVEEWQSKVQRAIATGSTIEPLDVVVTCKDGTKKNILWGFTSAGDMNIAFGLDITERRKAEEALAAERQRLLVTLRSIGDGVISTDGQGRVTLLNAVAEALTGWSDPEARGKPLSEVFRIINEQTRRPAVDPVRRVLSDGRVQALANHTALVCRDGTERSISDSAAPIRDQDGKVIGVVLTFRDVTERRKSEEAVRESEERFRSLFENMRNGLAHCRVIFDGDRPQDVVYLAVNQAFEAQTGLKDVVGRKASEVIPGIWEADRGLLEVYGRVARTGVPEQLEIYLEALRQWFAISAYSPGRDHFVAVFDVITERKRAEEQVRRLNVELEERVAQRTALLKMAVEELEAFSYSVSHDLQAPLRAMDGFSQALLEDYPDQLDARGRDYLSRVRGGAQRMAQMIEGFLKLSRAGRAELQRKPVDLGALAREAVTELRRSNPGRDVEFTAVGDLRAEGDSALLRIVLDNLLGNAWKFTAKTAQAKVEFGAAPSGTELAFCVRDNGAGFDASQAGRLFGAFQRLHGSAEFPGSGIGLATVRRIIHRHGGRVWAEGEVGKGAAVYFTLPSRPDREGP